MFGAAAYLARKDKTDKVVRVMVRL